MESDGESKALVPADQRPLTGVAGHHGIVVPRVIAAAGDQAARRFLEFFAATIRNKNTRQGLLPRRCARSSPGSTGTRSARSPTSSRCMWLPISRRSARTSRSRRSSSTWPPSACCSTGWSPARSLPPTRPTRSAVRSMSSRRGKTTVLDRRTGPRAPRQHRHVDPGRPARPGADRRDDLRLRPHRRGRRHARRGLLPQGQTLVGAAARERRQAP